LNVDETICRLMIFSYPSLQLIRVYKFRTAPLFDLYSTNEIIDALPDENEQMDFVSKDKDVKSEVWEIGDDIDE